MEITDVKTFLCEATPGSASYYSFVKVYTDEGLTGVGQSFGWGIGPAVTEALVKQFKRALVGQDAFNIEHMWKAMHRECSFFTILLALAPALDDRLGNPTGNHRMSEVQCLQSSL